ncbi:MAG: exodeoxyribonuclease V subunit beta [Rubricoccaceae bacterium]
MDLFSNVPDSPSASSSAPDTETISSAPPTSSPLPLGEEPKVAVRQQGEGYRVSNELATTSSTAPPDESPITSFRGDSSVPLTREGNSVLTKEQSDRKERGGSPAPFHALDAPIAPGITLVEASAGTGKTYALTELVLRLVLDPEARQLDGPDGLPDLRRLLVVTFTVAATEELKTRIRRALRLALAAFERGDAAEEAPALVQPFIERFGDAPERAVRRLRRALALAGEAGVFTIHGFCKRILERSAFESGEPFAFDFTEDADRLRQRAARDVWHGLLTTHPDLGRLAIAAGWSLDRLLEHESHATRYADTTILPAAQDLTDALGAVDAARLELARIWDADEALTVVPAEFFSRSEKTHGDLAVDRPGLFRRVAQFAQGDIRQLDAVRTSSTEKVTAAITYKNRSGPKAAVANVLANPGLLACDAVLGAVEALEQALVHAFVNRVGDTFQALKERAGVLTFDDLVDRLAQALGPEATTREALVRSIQAQFAVALIDEFQDTDPTQYQLFRTAFEGRPLFFIGDPKQAIYAFRGADVFAYLAAKTDARDTYTLGTNYRSAPRLVDAVNAVFGRLGPEGRPFIYDGIPFQPVASASSTPALRGVTPEASMVWWRADELKLNKRKEVGKENGRLAAMDATVTEICRLLNDPAVQIRETDSEDSWRPLEAGDIAVLVRKNQQARDLQDMLRHAGITSVVGRGDDIRESREMDELERVLRAVARPSDRRTVRAALATEMWGWTAADFLADTDDTRLEQIAEHLRHDRIVWRNHGVFRMLTGLLRREGIAPRLQGYADRERRLTNLRHAIELLHEVEGAEGRSPDELLHWVRTRMSRTFAQSSAVEMRLESDADAVQLVTMHNAKGLEYPVVFAPFVWDESEKETWFGSFEARPPVAHVDGGRRAVYDLGSNQQDHHQSLADAERLAESLRLTYVALTRAKERLYLMWGPLSGGHMSALGHLFRDLPLPLADGLATLNADTKTTAQKALTSSMERLVEWIDEEDLSAHMATAPLPSGGGRVERRDASTTATNARPLTSELANRIATHAGTGSFSSWASGLDADARQDRAIDDDIELADAPETGIFAFAAGPRAGTCLHEILQYADFASSEELLDPESDASERVERRLRLHGLHHPRTHRADLDPTHAVCEMVAKLASTPIPGFGFALADVEVTRSGLAAEWQFHAPRTTASPTEIASVFETHGDDALRAYASTLAGLDAATAEDLFTGIADLVVQHPAPSDDAPASPFYVFDWKSNHLGPTAAHYGSTAIARTMRTHHYTLQAHLYVVGLHRHLRARLGAAYDYDQHVGGVAVVFLRGITEATGWWTAKPSRQLVEALDALLFADVHLASSVTT